LNASSWGTHVGHGMYKLHQPQRIIKVEALVVDHLRNLGAEGEEYEVVKIFPM